MRSPKDMGIIEIDITNACVHSCSNCTRFCGHHKQPYFMELEFFKRAVDSLEGYEGQIGIMGGEPTLHPQFEKIVEYIKDKKRISNVSMLVGPVSDMQFHIESMVNDYPNAKTVLLSSISRSYYKNIEIINDTFEHQLLNDHSSDSLHQALLMSRKELGIDDDTWLERRDNCWIQNTWSASITPKGAFFCEVAGALDMLFDGPGGWKVESGWWKRKPSDFGDQMKWCEYCSACLDAPKRLSHDERDDVTPGIYEKLLKADSPKLKQGKVVVRNPKEFDEYKNEGYQTGDEYITAADNIRMGNGNSNLFPIKIRNIKSFKNILVESSDDWIVVGDISADIKVFLKSRIWNIGNLYMFNNGTVFFNANAKAMKNINGDSINRELLERSYSDEKTVYIDMNDKYLFLCGGETKAQRRKFRREDKRIVVLGAGDIGRQTAKKLVDNGISDFEIAVTNGDTGLDICGHKVMNVREFMDCNEEVAFLLATTYKYHSELIGKLKDLGFKYWLTLA